MSKNLRWKTKEKFLTLIVIGCFLLNLMPQDLAIAKDSSPEVSSTRVVATEGQNSLNFTDSDFHLIPETQETRAPSQASAAESNGDNSSDGFGYTWDDSLPMDWVDVSSGTDTGLSGSSEGQFAGPIDLGFTFPYYENVYPEVFIGGSGFLTFEGSTLWPNQSQIPTASSPNNVIAPYWAPLFLSEEGPNGRIYYSQGGEAPQRFFVVAWVEVAGGKPSDPNGGDDRFTFQVILYENGDIRFQYAQMQFVGSGYCGSAGIEDSTGEDGLNTLAFCTPAPSDWAVHFSRPQPAARLRITPNYQSSFISPGEAVAFLATLSNLGDLGQDTFDLEVEANWTVELFATDGETPLTDTDGDGQVDTGALAEQDKAELVVKISAPNQAIIGSNDKVVLRASSSLDTSLNQTVTFQVAVPTRFTQIFRDDADGAMSLMMAQPKNTLIKQATGTGWWGYDPAVAETPEGNYIYLWQRWRYVESTQSYISQLEYMLLSHAGEPLTAVQSLVGQGSTAFQIFDEAPVIAVTPDGTIGVAWRRRIIDEGMGGIRENWNVFFILLDQDGTVTHGPINLTKNTEWYQPDEETPGVPRFWNLRIAANAADQFALTWHQGSQELPGGNCAENCALDDIFFTILDSDGAVVKSNTNLTADSLNGNEGYSAPVVTAISEGRWLLVYNHVPGGLAISVVDQGGELLQGRSFIGVSGWSPVALQPEDDGAIIVAWTAWTGANPQIHLVALDDETLQKVSGTEILTNPAATSGGDFPSLSADAQGNAILTWMDFNANNRNHLYYALLDETGQVKTPPMVFYTAEARLGDSPHVETGFTGYSLTANRQFVDLALGDWAASWVERLYDAGITAGCQADPPQYCPTKLVKRSEMAVFLERGIRGAQFVPQEATGTVFADVAQADFAAAWIETLAADGITAGCGERCYCPQEPVTRAQMAIFLLRAKYGEDYNPPAVSQDTGFEDVAPTDFAAAWIKQLASEGITAGCGDGNFCPNQAVTRGQMAVFLVRTFDLP